MLLFATITFDRRIIRNNIFFHNRSFEGLCFRDVLMDFRAEAEGGKKWGRYRERHTQDNDISRLLWLYFYKKYPSSS